MLTFALMTFTAVRASQVIVMLKQSQEQINLIKETKDDSSVAWQLMQPLSRERLQELEKVTGMTLFDHAPAVLGGRVLRIRAWLSEAEMATLLEKLNTVPWVDYAEENTSAEIHHLGKKSKFLRPSGQ